MAQSTFQGLNFFILSTTIDEIHFYESLVKEGVPWYTTLEPTLRGDIVDHPVYGGGCSIPRPLHLFLPSLSSASSFVLQGVDKGLDPKAAYAKVQSVLALCGTHELGLSMGSAVYMTLSQARSLDVLDLKSPLINLWVAEPQDSFLRESIGLAKAEPWDREYLGEQERLARNSKFDSLYRLIKIYEKPIISGKQWALSLGYVMGILGQPG
jgi:hypothetical protein